MFFYINVEINVSGLIYAAVSISEDVFDKSHLF